MMIKLPDIQFLCQHSNQPDDPHIENLFLDKHGKHQLVVDSVKKN